MYVVNRKYCIKQSQPQKKSDPFAVGSLIIILDCLGGLCNRILAKFNQHMHYSVEVLNRNPRLARVVALGKNCIVKAWIANELRRWSARLKILRCFQWMRQAEKQISIASIALNCSAHRNTVRQALGFSISECKKALKMLRWLRIRAWSKRDLWGEQAEVFKQEYLNLFNEAKRVWHDGKVKTFEQVKKQRTVRRLALRASGLFRSSKLETPQVGTFSTSNHDPPYD